MQFDTSLLDHDGHEVASYGPRYINTSGGPDVDHTVEECKPGAAEFWGVYIRVTQPTTCDLDEPDRLAECVGDAVDEHSAKAFAHAMFELHAGYRHVDHPAFHPNPVSG